MHFWLFNHIKYIIRPEIKIIFKIYYFTLDIINNWIELVTFSSYTKSELAKPIIL